MVTRKTRDGMGARAVALSLGSFSIDDGDGNDNATNKKFDWSTEEK